MPLPSPPSHDIGGREPDKLTRAGLCAFLFLLRRPATAAGAVAGAGAGAAWAAD